MKLNISIGYATDKGVKADNEDFFGSLVPKEPQLTYKGIAVAIADGMSGSEAGKQASHCCVLGFLSDYYSTPDSWSVKQAGQKILSATNSWLYSQGQLHYGTSKGMVSTLSILVLKSTTANVFHIGDTRIYRLRNGDLEQLTRDHRIWVSMDKNYLNRAMGIEPRLEVDYQTFALEKGDIFIMTTDGVHDFVDDRVLKAFLIEGKDLTVQARNIVKLALDNGSDDNLTCQIIRVDDLPQVKADEIIRRHNNLPFPPPLEKGMVLDGYRIEEEIHSSKRTEIYKAVDIESNTLVILKAPSVLYDDDTHYIEHFLHEEWAGKRISHDNVLKVLNPNRNKSCIYYVTEFIDGRTLRQWMDKNSKANIDTVRNIIEQIAKGLQAFHRMEMLHQDLKPENIMFGDATVKIIDFGSVKIAGISEISPLVDDNVLGTLSYTAPEYHIGQQGSIQSDIFSLGVIGYELFNGALPFGQAITEKLSKNDLDKLVYVPSMYCNEMIPNWIDGALKKATAINPQHRYETLSEFLYDLQHPNPIFLKPEAFVPVVQRNPLLFWKSVSLFLLVCNLILIYQLV